MPRRGLIITMIVSLIAGAVITAAVGVACSLWSHPQMTQGAPQAMIPTQMADMIPPNSQAEILLDYSTGVGLEHSVFYSAGLRARCFAARAYFGFNGYFPKEWVFYEQRAGWPVPALQSSAVSHTGNPLQLHGGVELPKSNTVDPARWPVGIPPHVPLRPTIGFMIDTLIYAYACFSAFMLARMAVRARRYQGNRCRACGYQRLGLAMSAPCPECGSNSNAAIS